MEMLSDLQMVWRHWRIRHSPLPWDQAWRFLWWRSEVFVLKDQDKVNWHPFS